MTEGTRPWEELERILEDGSAEDVEHFLEELPPGETPRVIANLSEAERTTVLRQLDAEHAAELLEHVAQEQARDLIEHLEPQEAAAILHELPSDEKVDLLNEIGADDVEAILAEMDPEEAASTLELSRYPADVAGGLMITEFLSYHREQTVDDVRSDLREHGELYRDYDIQYAYVTKRSGRLEGVLRLRDLLLAGSKTPIKDLALPDPVSLNHRASLDEVEDFFERHAFLGAPVVDENGKLLGVVRRSAVADALARRSDSDYIKSQGIVGGEELRTMSLLLRSRRRLSWLSVNIVLNIIAASIIAFFQDTLSSVIALAVFLPIISDMSGCSGNQAVAVSIRELTLGLITPNDALRVWSKELAVGFVNGLVLGGLIGAVTYVWKGNLYLSLVVGAAMSVNTLVAVSVGGLVPVVLKRFRMDPALASGPILTTVTDMCGFLLILGLATLLLPQLTAG